MFEGEKEKVLLIVDAEKTRWMGKNLSDLNEDARVNFAELKKIVVEDISKKYGVNSEIIESFYVSNSIVETKDKNKFYSVLTRNGYKLELPDSYKDIDNWVDQLITEKLSGWIDSIIPDIVIIVSGKSYIIEVLSLHKNLIKTGIAAIDNMVSNDRIQELNYYINLEDYKDRLIFLRDERIEVENGKCDETNRVELSITLEVTSNEIEIKKECVKELQDIGKKFMDEKIDQMNSNIKPAYKIRVY